jgi:hypothetical protein
MIKIIFYLYIGFSASILIIDICFKVLNEEQRSIAFHTVLFLNVIFSFIYKKNMKIKNQ